MMERKGTSLALMIIILVSGLSMVRCAKQGTPAGGPKDETPPEVVSAEPPQRTLYFNAKKITVDFNEFISLKDPSKEIFISPPMKTKPEFKAQGKKLVIEFQEELKENSTYTINFGNAVVDFTEGNPLVNFEYVFSTGEHIDSLSLPGKVLDAFSLEPVPEVLVMVYQDNNDTITLDSLPLMVQPKNASRTTKTGDFRINNLAPGQYMIFALEDLNNNYIFDLPNERIAFLDSMVILVPPEPVVFPADSADTVNVETPEMAIIEEKSYDLYLFQQADTTQKLISKKLIGNILLQYAFKRPVDSIDIIPIGFVPPEPNWYIPEYSKQKDTLNLWLKTGLPDTIRVCISMPDSICDTARFVMDRKQGEKAGKKKDAAKQGLVITSNSRAGAFDLNKQLTLAFSVPVTGFDSSLLTLAGPVDTITPLFTFTDSLQRNGIIMHKWVPGDLYSIAIDDSAFRDISGNYNDSTFFRFKVRTIEDYGVLIMHIFLPDQSSPYIIQLLTEKGNPVDERIITSSGFTKFEYLMAGNYKLKAICDSNRNGKWDPGNYHDKQLPEKVEFYSQPLVIRANWDMQEEWLVNKNGD
jgi:uncharacterized protein (DUF2141 family)